MQFPNALNAAYERVRSRPHSEKTFKECRHTSYCRGSVTGIRLSGWAVGPKEALREAQPIGSLIGAVRDRRDNNLKPFSLYMLYIDNNMS
jgi:hypothetical protein